MEDVVVLDGPVPDPAVSELEIARMRLRQRWELASVLHFLHVFEELIQSGLKMSGEEIEAGLIQPNEDLASLHIAILKGIPPVTKNLKESDAWVTAVCKKLASWWPWVAEGENPFGPDHREAIERYKEFDATSRLVILKALCEVRAEQDDLLRYISDALKEGSGLTVFRKERIGSNDNGTTYWYDGDAVIGHRLYREIIQVEPKKRLKGKGSSAKPVVDSKWETLATNLEEFHKISEKLSSGKIMSEVTVAKIINTDIIPVLEKFQKNKERALKRRQRESLLLDNIMNYSALGI
ncbi:DDT domain-containing protein DDR4 [Dioscorea cayenensis subsp. rotundata]|uniref:DDT domain-containing protein DDR4 n=1 Tax=Dioscorea cayennensis subsp. rotundata TaxID=55577 RepID=A0AB40CYK0_DIOCR|nr:DDT domain-containing protein DDR4 [Dioscorea cayenensis subsp. rotundata]